MTGGPVRRAHGWRLAVDAHSEVTVDPNTVPEDCPNGVDLTDLRPLTKLLVWTTHSLYELIMGEDGGLYVEGGTFFPGRTAAEFVGARLGRYSLKVGWIWVGLPMEIAVGDRHVVTSPVHRIIAQPPGTPIVH
jgi:hypothetical protein